MSILVDLVIDASKIRSGGGIEHAFQFYKNLKSCTDKSFMFFVSGDLLRHINLHSGEDDRLILINGLGIKGTVWQFFNLRYMLYKLKSPLLISLDASSACFYKNSVVVHQDMLAFSYKYWLFKGGIAHQIRNLMVFILQVISIRRARHVVFQSGHAKFVVSKYIDIPPSSVIPHAVERQGVLKSHCKKTTEECINLLCVSPIYGYKDYPTVLNSIVKLNLKKKKVILRIAGGFADKAEVERLTDFVGHNNLAKSVEFLGDIPHKEVMLLMQKSDMLIFSSRCETFGITLLEAMQNSLPIVCCDYPVYKEIISQGGVFFPIGNSDYLTSLLDDFLENPKKVEHVCYEQHKNLSNFDWDSSMDRTVKVVLDEMNSINTRN